jgi:hypothetical protein
MLPEQVRQTILGDRLGVGYAQMITLTSTPDISDANYRVRGENNEARISVLRLPYESRLVDLTADDALYWRMAAGYMTVKLDNAVTFSLPQGDGGANTQWTAYSGSAGLVAKFRVADGFSIEPAIDAGLARLTNEAQYFSVAQLFQPELDKLLINWATDEWIVTPNIAVAWTPTIDTRELELRAHVAYSRIASFSSDLVQGFNEWTGVFSVIVAYGIPTNQRVFDRALRYSVTAGYSGFFGPKRDALGFDSVTRVGVGVGLRFGTGSDRRYLQLDAAYLFGPQLTGWVIELGLPL